MEATLKFTHNGYSVGSSYPLSSAQLARIVELFQSPPQPENRQLGGRTSVSRFQLEGIGAVIIKHYRRGGILANLINQYYLRINKTRSQIEFEQMAHVREVGVKVPKPVAYAYRGTLIYKAWLVSQEIMHSQTMAEFSLNAPDRIANAMEALDQQVRILVDNQIMHADFHPGNILIDNREQIYIIDFDKSTICRDDTDSLELRYRKRWCRAVKKYGLPPELCTLMRAGNS